MKQQGAGDDHEDRSQRVQGSGKGAVDSFFGNAKKIGRQEASQQTGKKYHHYFIAGDKTECFDRRGQQHQPGENNTQGRHLVGGKTFQSFFHEDETAAPDDGESDKNEPVQKSLIHVFRLRRKVEVFITK